MPGFARVGGAGAAARSRSSGARARGAGARRAVPAGLALRLRLLPDRHPLDRAAVRRRDHRAVAQVPGVAGWRPPTSRCSRGWRRWLAGCRRGRRRLAAPACRRVRGSRVPLALAFPVVFVAVEWLRGSGELGFPWFQPGYTQHAYVPILQLASLGGVGLVTLWVVCLNVLLWRSVTGGARGAGGAGRAAARAAALARGGSGRWTRRAGAGADAARRRWWRWCRATSRARSSGRGGTSRRSCATFLDAVRRRRRGREPRPALAIWPETATGQLPAQAARPVARRAPRFADAHARAGLLRLRRLRLGLDRRAALLQRGRPVRGPTARSARCTRSATSCRSASACRSSALLPWLGRIDLGQAEWTPGRATVLFPSAAGPFACLVCFESIFPDLARADVRRGRAVAREHHERRVVRRSAALSPARRDGGVPRGGEPRAAGALREHRPDAAGGRERARGRDGCRCSSRACWWRRCRRRRRGGSPTPYTRFGDWPSAACLAALGALAVVAVAAVALTPARPRGYHAACASRSRPCVLGVPVP